MSKENFEEDVRKIWLNDNGICMKLENEILEESKIFDKVCEWLKDMVER